MCTLFTLRCFNILPVTSSSPYVEENTKWSEITLNHTKIPDDVWSHLIKLPVTILFWYIAKLWLNTPRHPGGWPDLGALSWGNSGGFSSLSWAWTLVYNPAQLGCSYELEYNTEKGKWILKWVPFNRTYPYDETPFLNESRSRDYTRHVSYKVSASLPSFRNHCRLACCLSSCAW